MFHASNVGPKLRYMRLTSRGRQEEVDDKVEKGDVYEGEKNTNKKTLELKTLITAGRDTKRKRAECVF